MGKRKLDRTQCKALEICLRLPLDIYSQACLSSRAGASTEYTSTSTGKSELE